MFTPRSDAEIPSIISQHKLEFNLQYRRNQGMMNMKNLQTVRRNRSGYRR